MFFKKKENIWFCRRGRHINTQLADRVEIKAVIRYRNRLLTYCSNGTSYFWPRLEFRIQIDVQNIYQWNVHHHCILLCNLGPKNFYVLYPIIVKYFFWILIKYEWNVLNSVHPFFLIWAKKNPRVKTIEQIMKTIPTRAKSNVSHSILDALINKIK